MIAVQFWSKQNQKEVAKKIFLNIMPVPCLFGEVNGQANQVDELSLLNSAALILTSQVNVSHFLLPASIRSANRLR
jgi:hypothetical protein